MSTERFEELSAGSPHGTRSRYRSGCRCDGCREANTQAQRRRRARIRAGHTPDAHGGYDTVPLRTVRDAYADAHGGYDTVPLRTVRDAYADAHGGYDALPVPTTRIPHADARGGYTGGYENTYPEGDAYDDDAEAPGIPPALVLLGFGVGLGLILWAALRKTPGDTPVRYVRATGPPPRPRPPVTLTPRPRLPAPVGQVPAYEVVFSGCGHIVTFSRPGELVTPGTPVAAGTWAFCGVCGAERVVAELRRPR